VKKYFADTNFYLRFLLQDNLDQADRVEKDLRKAEQKKIKIVFLSVVILEMAFVLQKTYSLARAEIAKYLLGLVKTNYLEIEDRKIWMEVWPIYSSGKVDLTDIFLFKKTIDEGGEVLSFDQDFKKLARRR